MRWWRRNPGDPALLESRFGKLELRVMEALWQREESASVRDLQPHFPQSAYTTLMTTLDRLHRKGVLARDKQGRAFRYSPNFTRSEFEAARAASAVRAAVESGGSLTPLVSCLVDAVGDRDRDPLDELEALVAARQAELKNKRP